MFDPKSGDISRRQLLRAAAGAGFAAFAASRSALAQGAAQPVSASDPLAKALGFVTDAAQVDRAKYPTYKPGQQCAKCRFFQGAAGAKQGPCQIFGGKLVEAGGWCSSFVAKA